MERIYLDYAATTPVDGQVLAAMEPYFGGTFGNASSVHWYGQQARLALERSREIIARAIGAHPGELFFTSGGTESDNLAIQGVVAAARKKGSTHVIIPRAEHHAVLDCCEQIADRGVPVTFLPVDSDGRVSVDDVAAAIIPGTCLVSVMHANNEVGSISSLPEIAGAVHERGVLLHSDAVQTLGKIPVNVEELGVDLMTISAHKLYGPKGVGALYIRRGTEVSPLFHGGGQERGKRPGTENVALVVGFAAAVEMALAEMDGEASRLRALRDRLEKEIRAMHQFVIINGHPTDRLPHILSVSFDSRRQRLEGEMLVVNMDLKGIAVSSGSACTSGSVQPSHVLLAMGRDEATARATLRFSFGRANSAGDVEAAISALSSAIPRTLG